MSRIGMRMIVPPLDRNHEDYFRWKRWRMDDGAIVDRNPSGEWFCTCSISECPHIPQMRQFTESMKAINEAINENPESDYLEVGSWRVEPLRRDYAHN